MESDDRPPLLVDEALTRRLRALLALDPVRAEQVREVTPARRRPRRQVGPSADYGVDGQPD